MEKILLLTVWHLPAAFALLALLGLIGIDPSVRGSSLFWKGWALAMVIAFAIAMIFAASLS